MNTILLFNRAIANGSLSREQEKAIFAKSGGHGGGTAFGGSADKAHDKQIADTMTRARKMVMSLGLSMIGGIGVAGEAKAAKTLGGIIRQARSGMGVAKAERVAESPGRYAPTLQARRNELAAQLRRDRELKRLDLHPDLFFDNRMPPARSDEERRRRAFWASKGDGMFRAKGVVVDPNDARQLQANPGFAPGSQNGTVHPDQTTPEYRAWFQQRQAWEQQQQGSQRVGGPVPVGTPRPTPDATPKPNPPPRQRPTPPGGPDMPIGGPAPVYGEPGTRPADRTGGPAPVGGGRATPGTTPRPTPPVIYRDVNSPGQPLTSTPGGSVTFMPQQGEISGQSLPGQYTRAPAPNILGGSPTSQLFPNLLQWQPNPNTVRQLPASDAARLASVIAALGATQR